MDGSAIYDGPIPYESMRECCHLKARRARVALLAILLLLCGTLAPAVWAGTTGKISGRVTDPTGEPLPGVQIVLDGTSTGTVTDLDGYYDMINLKPGVYALVFRYVGFAETRVENVNVVVDKTTTIDITMREEVIEGEEVVVTAERPLVEMDRTTTTSYVDEAQLAALPVSNIGDVINLQAGVVDGHFRGGRTGEVAYLVNGMPINNPLNNSAAFDIEKNMVSGLEVISGVFNAEYGQAMSGIVNIVTKDAPSSWSGSIATEVGGVASNRELEYLERTSGPGATLRSTDFQTVYVPYYKAAGAIGRTDLQASIGGPLIKNRLGINLSGRYYHADGNEISRRLFVPSDSSQNLDSPDANNWILASTGDQSYVPSYHDRYTLNGSLTFRLSRMMRLEYNGMYQRNHGWNLGYDNYHTNKYNPDGENRYYNRSQFHMAGLQMTFGAKAFANLNYSYLRDRGESRLYDIPNDFDATGVLDSRYVSNLVGNVVGTAMFATGGNDLYNGADLTETHALMADFTNQITRAHQIKMGVSARLHHLWRGNYSIDVTQSRNYVPQPSINPWGRDTMEVRPMELAAYIQDKMEVNNLIVNAGVRFDYFQPDFKIPVDWGQADSLQIPSFDENGAFNGYVSNREQAPVRFQVSPRLGIAFPISASGVVRFSAGLFFQTPRFDILYRNPNYEVSPDATVDFGNAGLDPERTLQFEIGLQQGLTESLGMEMTLFSKDIRNLIGVEVRRDLQSALFVRYINRDVGTSRGITLSLFQKPVGPIAWDIDYTLQFAGGTSSDPREAFQRFQAQQDDILRLVRLDWDRRHVLTNSITLTPAKALMLTMVNRFQSGRPYTTRRKYRNSLIENNADRPSTFTSDVRVYYRPGILGNLSLMAQIENLFDTRSHNEVYNDTGRADESVDMELYRRSGAEAARLNTLEDYYIETWRFSGPRRLIVGLRYEF